LAHTGEMVSNVNNSGFVSHYHLHMIFFICI
jgi:hypothetical protein